MKPTVLVTGASSGIGVGVVEVLCEAGYPVHAVARRRDRLQALAMRTGCTVRAVDVTDPGSVSALLEDVKPQIIVCNAGRGGGFDGIAGTTRDDIAATVDLNVTATLDLIRQSLPAMIAHGRGHIVTIGSVAALYPSVSALYGGTKAAVGMIAQNLRLELHGTGIRVTDIRPGRVASEFYDVAIEDRTKSAVAKDTRIRELQPREIGDAILYAISAPHHVNVSAIELQPLEQTYGGFNFDAWS